MEAVQQSLCPSLPQSLSLSFSLSLSPHLNRSVITVMTKAMQLPDMIYQVSQWMSSKFLCLNLSKTEILHNRFI